MLVSGCSEGRPNDETTAGSAPLPTQARSSVRSNGRRSQAGDGEPSQNGSAVMYSLGPMKGLPPDTTVIESALAVADNARAHKKAANTLMIFISSGKNRSASGFEQHVAGRPDRDLPRQ